jgi:hypothetical protein
MKVNKFKLDTDMKSVLIGILIIGLVIMGINYYSNGRNSKTDAECLILHPSSCTANVAEVWYNSGSTYTDCVVSHTNCTIANKVCSSGICVSSSTPPTVAWPTCKVLSSDGSSWTKVADTYACKDNKGYWCNNYIQNSNPLLNTYTYQQVIDCDTVGTGCVCNAKPDLSAYCNCPGTGKAGDACTTTADCIGALKCVNSKCKAAVVGDGVCYDVPYEDCHSSPIDCACNPTQSCTQVASYYSCKGGTVENLTAVPSLLRDSVDKDKYTPEDLVFSACSTNAMCQAFTDTDGKSYPGSCIKTVAYQTLLKTSATHACDTFEQFGITLTDSAACAMVAGAAQWLPFGLFISADMSNICINGAVADFQNLPVQEKVLAVSCQGIKADKLSGICMAEKPKTIMDNINDGIDKMLADNGLGSFSGIIKPVIYLFGGMFALMILMMLMSSMTQMAQPPRY